MRHGLLGPVGHEHVARSVRHHQPGDRAAGCAEPDLPDARLLQRDARQLAGIDQRGERDRGRAVLVVVHDGFV
jgi:hypothetical protein